MPTIDLPSAHHRIELVSREVIALGFQLTFTDHEVAF